MMIHDSHDLYFRNPFGAVPCGEKITLRLKLSKTLLAHSVVLRTWRDVFGEEKFHMAEIGQDDNYKTFEACIKAPQHAGLFWYFFIIYSPDRTYFYGNNTDHTGGSGQVYDYQPDSYQITVYDRKFETPAWFKECVIYQIFVDRFYNGNEYGCIPINKANCIIHEDWNEAPFHESDPETGKYQANDFFGGNLFGIIKKLPYLKELGIDVIYLNPIFDSSSNHKYNTGDYLKVDPMFGNNETFAELCKAGKDMGISIILDGVFSHTGSDSIYFNKYGNYPSLGAYQSKGSPYYPWYTFTKYPQSYECWWGVDTLPSVNELDPSYRDFILYNKDSVVKYWMKLGCRGWRLDVADELPDEFLKDLRRTVTGADSEAVIIGEVWDDASNKKSYGKLKEYLLGSELDSVTNYPLRSAIINFFTGQWDAVRFHRAIMSLYENYPACSFYSMMNILGSHDTVRIKTVLGRLYLENENTGYILSEEETTLSIKRLKLASLFQMTFPGVPCIYYGDEAGLAGGKDPFCRRTYPWGREDTALIEWYKKIIDIRHKYDALKTGSFVPLYHKDKTYGFARIIRNEKDTFSQKRKGSFVIVLFNSSANDTHDVDITLSEWKIEKLLDILNNNLQVSTDNGHLRIKLMPLQGILFIAGNHQP